MGESSASGTTNFCEIMNAIRYFKVNNNVVEAAISVQKETTLLAVKVEFDISEKKNTGMTAELDIDVSVDGSWMTRGHSSNVGVATLIELVTENVLNTDTQKNNANRVVIGLKKKHKKKQRRISKEKQSISRSENKITQAPLVRWRQTRR